MQIGWEDSIHFCNFIWALDMEKKRITHLKLLELKYAEKKLMKELTTDSITSSWV